MTVTAVAASTAASTPWVDWSALGDILLVGLLAGAGMVAVFALGIATLSAGKRTVGGPQDGQPPGPPRPVAVTVAGVCFAAVIAVVAVGLIDLLRT